MIGYKDGLAGVIRGHHSLRACHDAAQPGDLALVHRLPAPIGDQVPIDRDGLPHRFRYQRRPQDLVGPDTLKVPKKLAQR